MTLLSPFRLRRCCMLALLCLNATRAPAQQAGQTPQLKAIKHTLMVDGIARQYFVVPARKRPARASAAGRRVARL